MRQNGGMKEDWAALYRIEARRPPKAEKIGLLILLSGLPALILLAPAALAVYWMVASEAGRSFVLLAAVGAAICAFWALLICLILDILGCR